MKTQPRFLLSGFLALALVWTAFAGAMLARSPEKPLTGYNAIVVDEFNIEETEKTLGFSSRMLETFRSEVIDRLDGDRIFEEVIDGMEVAMPAAGTEASSQEETEANLSEKQLRLSGTVIKFSKGSRAKRALIGFGSGGTTIKVRFVLRDAETGTELLRTERKGKYSGTFSVAGGGQQAGIAEAAGDVVDGLIKEINKNR